MNGRAHLLSAVFILAPIVLAFSYRGELAPLSTLILLLGAFLGIIAPDVDGGALSANYKPIGVYGKRDGQTVLAEVLDKVGGVLGWIFTNVSRYFFFKPLVLFLHVAGYRGIAQHRGVMHSFFAALLCTSFWVLVALLLSLALAFGPSNAFVFGAGLLAGYLFHLYCDSITPHGVNWMFPSEFVLHGRIKTGSALYGRGVKFFESQLFALTLFAVAGTALIWMILKTSASASFIAVLAAFSLLICAAAMGVEAEYDKFGEWQTQGKYY